MDSGVKNQISIGVETTYGSAVVPTTSLPVHSSDGINVNQEVIGVEAIKGTAPKNKSMFLGKQSFEGSYELGVYPQSIGYLLKSALGSSSTSTVESGAVYKHTFSESLTKSGLTVEQVIGTITKRFAGWIPNKLTLAGNVGELVTLTAEGFAKAQADASKITASYETVRPFTWADFNVISIGGTDIKAKVESIELEYDNGVEMFYGVGSIQPQNFYPKQSTFKGKIECFVDSSTDDYLASLMSGTQAELIVELKGDAIGSTSFNTLKFTATDTSFTKFETSLDFNYNALSLEFEASEDTSNGLVKVELTNTVSSY